MRTIYLYGLGGSADNYKVIRYSEVDGEGLDIMSLKYEAARMRMDYPGIQHVYAVDWRPGLYRSYKDTIKKNNMEACIIFRDMLTRNGVEVI